MSAARAGRECGRCKKGDAGDPIGSPKQPDAADAVPPSGEARSGPQTSVANLMGPRRRADSRRGGAAGPDARWTPNLRS